MRPQQIRGGICRVPPRGGSDLSHNTQSRSPWPCAPTRINAAINYYINVTSHPARLCISHEDMHAYHICVYVCMAFIPQSGYCVSPAHRPYVHYSTCIRRRRRRYYISYRTIEQRTHQKSSLIRTTSRRKRITARNT